MLLGASEQSLWQRTREGAVSLKSHLDNPSPFGRSTREGSFDLLASVPAGRRIRGASRGETHRPPQMLDGLKASGGGWSCWRRGSYMNGGPLAFLGWFSKTRAWLWALGGFTKSAIGHLNLFALCV